jgi:hypothetical protein
MRVIIASRIIALPLLLVLGTASHGQSSHFVVITPEKATLLVGESRRFRLVDQDGQMQKEPSWSVSDDEALQPRTGAELIVVAKTAGEYTIRGQSSGESAEATVTVVEGTSLPMGTVKWSGPAIEGCTSKKATPAVPSPGGADVFDQSVCRDGEYIAAYSADGILLWRRKIGGGLGGPLPAPRNNSAAGAATAGAGRFNVHAASVCDALAIGTTQQKIQDLLNERKLSFNSGSAAERTWFVEEPSAQCKLWFDEHSILTKKQKILVTD